jgi:hypothetical protein
VSDGKLQADDFLVFPDRFEKNGTDALALIPSRQVEEVAADPVLGPVAQHPQERRTGIVDDERRVELEDDVRDILDERPEVLLAKADLFLGVTQLLLAAAHLVGHVLKSGFQLRDLVSARAGLRHFREMDLSRFRRSHRQAVCVSREPAQRQ